MAYSGGRDSTALLHATARAAHGLGLHVVALHVHHGLNASADAWLKHGAAQCDRWQRDGLPVQFVATRLSDAPDKGDSIEAWARRERYRALRRMAMEHGADLVLLAHHRRDQAETFLLQALRSGSAAALSAMPVRAMRDGVTWARPWLARPDAAIDAYVRTHRLRHVVDGSNADTRMARNRLRADVWPALVAAFPDAEAALAAAATLAQAAAATMQEWAEVDLPSIASGNGLDIAAWRLLAPARRGNALHAWLRTRIGGDAVPRSLVQRLECELTAEKTRRWLVPAGALRSYRGVLRFVASGTGAATADATVGTATTDDAALSAGPASTTIDLRRVGSHAVQAWHGAFVVEPVATGGMSPTTASALDLRQRLPGDRFQAGPGRPPRSLKLQFQAAGVAAWCRDGPVLGHAGRIVYVPGLGIDARAIDDSGAPSLRITWRPD